MREKWRKETIEKVTVRNHTEGVEREELKRVEEE